MIEVRYGQRFHRLTVIERKHTPKGMRLYCICDCGQSKLVRPSDLVKHSVKSCGCRQKETQHENLAQYRQVTAAIALETAMKGWSK